MQLLIFTGRTFVDNWASWVWKGTHEIIICSSLFLLIAYSFFNTMKYLHTMKKYLHTKTSVSISAGIFIYFMYILLDFAF